MGKEEKNKETQNSAEQPADSGNDNTQPESQDSNNGESGQPESSFPQTQEELDKLIERRLKRERRAWEKEKHNSAETNPESEDPSDNSAELASLRAELAEAKAQSAAAKMGFRSEVTDDAVYLAMRIANKDSSGEPDDDDIKTALSEVLKKHSEWKADSDKKSTGFRVGAPPPQSENKSKPIAQKRWNRFNN